MVELDFINEMMAGFGKVIIPLVIIGLLIALIKWIQSFQKKGGTEIRVYKAPGSD